MRRAAAMLVLAGCGGVSLDRPTLVHDLRVLAIRAEPPEVMIDPLAPAPPPAIALTALVVDPAGGGRQLTWTWRACVEAEANLNGGSEGTDSGCPDDEALELAAGTSGPEGVAATLSPSVQYVLDAQRKDPLRGFGGLRILVQLDVSAGGEAVRAVKRVLYNAPIVPGMAANVNPVLAETLPGSGARVDGLLLGDAPWPAEHVPCLARNAKHRLKPVPAEGALESYVVPTFNLEPRELKEAWRYWWFATGGRMNAVTGGTFLGTAADEEYVSAWEATAKDPDGPVTFWVVVRDGRGGVTWTSRSATLAPSCPGVL